MGRNKSMIRQIKEEIKGHLKELDELEKLETKYLNELALLEYKQGVLRKKTNLN